MCEIWLKIIKSREKYYFDVSLTKYNNKLLIIMNFFFRFVSKRMGKKWSTHALSSLLFFFLPLSTHTLMIYKLDCNCYFGFCTQSASNLISIYSSVSKSWKIEHREHTDTHTHIYTKENGRKKYYIYKYIYIYCVEQEAYIKWKITHYMTMAFCYQRKLL